MACRKCGSDWTTATGKDCNRCPWCDKQQLFQARKQGRLPAVIQKTCRICGDTFTVKPTSQHAKTCSSRECQAVLAREKVLRHKERKALGLAVTMAPRQARKQCKRDGCDASVKNNKHEYCSPLCAGADAREYKRDFMGVPAESRRALALASWFVDEWHQQHVLAVRAESRRLCEVCQSPTAKPSQRFCCRRCMKAWRGEKQCVRCCKVMRSAAWCATVCKACKKIAARKNRKGNRNNFRRRAKHHGVEYTPIRRLAVYERDGWQCQLCGKMCKRRWTISIRTGQPHPRSPTIDHIVPMSKGGGHVMHNVQLACWQCNVFKGAKRKGQLLFALTE